MTLTSARTPARLLLPALLLTALALTGCSGGGADGGSSSSGSADVAASVAEPEAALDQDAALADTARNATSSRVAQEQALIRKGNVELRARDVGRAQIEVQKIVDRYAGQVTDERTETDRKGRAAYTRMVLRVPSSDFSKTVADLKGAADLVSAKTDQDDVTTEVIDVRTRIAVQKRSIARISVLFQQAKSIKDIMAIEAELSQRQADLEALEQQSAYLADQTTLSTIVVSIDRIPSKPAGPEHEDDDSGFLAGLTAGWGALTAFLVGLATVAGAVLPWLVVALVLGIPTLLLVRSLRRRRTSVLAPATAGDAPQPSE